MQGWTFGRRIAAGFAALIALTLALGGVSLYALRGVVAAKDHVILTTAQHLVDATGLRYAAQYQLSALRGFLLSPEDVFVERGRLARQVWRGYLQGIRGRDLSESARVQLVRIEREAAQFESYIERGLELRSGGTPAAELAQLSREASPAFDRLAEAIESFISVQDAARTEHMQHSVALAAQASRWLLAMAAGAVALVVGLGVLLSRSLASQIGGSVQHVRSSASELRSSAEQQARSAQEQALAMTEMTTTLSELLASSRQIAESARQVCALARGSQEAAQAGDRTAAGAHEAMTAMRQQVDVVVHHMLELGRKSQQIGGILEIINELAEQTNILAINATIEAAGAGEAGRRFAVVSDEIRKLADRVGGSAKEIRDLIEQIRAAVNSTVMATESGAKAVEVGSERFGELTAAFRSIGELVETTTQAAREIELSTQQQATAVEQVNIAAGSVAQASREAEAGSQQNAGVAAQLAQLSDQLSRLVRSPRVA